MLKKLLNDMSKVSGINSKTSFKTNTNWQKTISNSRSYYTQEHLEYLNERQKYFEQNKEEFYGALDSYKKLSKEEKQVFEENGGYFREFLDYIGLDDEEIYETHSQIRYYEKKEPELVKALDEYNKLSKEEKNRTSKSFFKDLVQSYNDTDQEIFDTHYKKHFKDKGRA